MFIGSQVVLELAGSIGGGVLAGGHLVRMGEVVLCGVKDLRAGVVDRRAEVDRLFGAGLWAGQMSGPSRPKESASHG